MARADLLCELIKYGLVDDSASFRKAAEALCAAWKNKSKQVYESLLDMLL